MGTFAFWIRIAVIGGAAVMLPTLFACLDHPLKAVEMKREPYRESGIPIAVNRDVDVLFVIDNSGSMGEEQHNIADNFASFIEELEKDGVEANYRIGITTTDVGNPICQGLPEAGRLRAQSCTERLDEFEFGDENQASACTDFCTVGSITTTDGKPWIESNGGVTNLPDGVSPVEAFQCFGPQGIDGCGMEAPLEAMVQFFTRTQSGSTPEADFLRDSAILAIIFLTDEADCSYAPGHESIFLREGDQTFWTNSNQATSGVCWNAGVECSGGPGTYTECHSANKDELGNLVGPEQAVLHPVSRYIDLVQSIEDHRKEATGQEVLVAVIGGVPDDYDSGADITYSDAIDPADHAQFGTGFGCTSSVAEAIPPVRLREFAEHFDTFEEEDKRNLYSVCEETYAPALDAIAKAITDQVKPACMPGCVADINETTDVLDPDCTLTQTVPAGSEDPAQGLESGTIPQCRYLCNGAPGEGCDRTNADDWQFPEGTAACVRLLTDSAQATPSLLDDMSDFCRDEGHNLEFAIERRGYAPPDITVEAACSISSIALIDCPNLD